MIGGLTSSVVPHPPVPCLPGVMGETMPFSRDQHLYLVWPSGGRRRVETPECPQIALGHGQRLAVDPFTLALPSGAREGGFRVRCWPHMPRVLPWVVKPTVAPARRCQIPRGCGSEYSKELWNLTERDLTTSSRTYASPSTRPGARRGKSPAVWRKRPHGSGVDMGNPGGGFGRSAAIPRLAVRPELRQYGLGVCLFTAQQRRRLE